MNNHQPHIPNKTENKLKSGWNTINNGLLSLDKRNLWWLGLFVIAASFIPFALLGEGSVFEIHDQLDETLMTYVLNARYLGTGTRVFPEMLGGVNASGMQPSAILFIPLYRFFSAFHAFVLQYMIVCISGYMGMYLTVREITKSSFMAVMAGGLFCMLPIMPVYGLSILGAPLLMYALLCLYQRKKIAVSIILVVYFGLTTHLVLIGYVVLSFWALAALVMIIRKKHNGWFYGGFLILTALYIVVNHSLFLELILGNSSYVSHREELVNYAGNIWDNIKMMFVDSAQHAPSLHKYLILPILALLAVEGICYKKLNPDLKRVWRLAAGILITLVMIAVLYGVYKSPWVTDWRNARTGFLRYFQLERFYWLAPALWYLEAGLVMGIAWKSQVRFWGPVLKLAVICVILLPTMKLVLGSSIFYTNVNQFNNGYGVTGQVSWESFYARELMQKLEDAIGRDMSQYRVGHLGMSPAPSLMHGFYTIDGYSNNYPLEYKHKFRGIIERELDKHEGARIYFDDWGSRCYLFSAETGVFWMLAKESAFKYQNLELDIEKMKELGCEYLFSGGEILGAEEMGLRSMGYFETENSFWGVWLYGL